MYSFPYIQVFQHSIDRLKLSMKNFLGLKRMYLSTFLLSQSEMYASNCLRMTLIGMIFLRNDVNVSDRFNSTQVRFCRFSFDSCLLHILHLLSTDSLGRFKRGALFKVGHLHIVTVHISIYFVNYTSLGEIRTETITIISHRNLWKVCTLTRV